LANLKITDFTADPAVDGTEILAVSDAANPRRTTISAIKDFVIDQVEAIAPGAAVAGADWVYILDATDSALKPVDVDLLTQHGIDTMWGKAAEGSPDGADILVLKDGGTTEKTVTLALVAEYVRATVEAAILDVSDLADGSGAIATTDYILVTQGTTGKQVTLADVNTLIYAGLDTHVTGLAAVTVTAATDVFYCVQGGTAKKVTTAEIATYLGDPPSAPGATTTNNIPQWSNATGDLKDGLSLATTVGAAPGDDTSIVSEQGVRESLDTLVYDQSEIGAAVVDADVFLMDDGNAGTAQRKCLASRLFTYVTTQIQGLSAKTVPIVGDILTIQDSADSNALKELTLSNLKMELDVVVPEKYTLTWMAGQGRLPQLNASIANEVADHDFEILGTNASDDDVTFYAEGGITLTTDGADGDEVIVLPHLDANQTAWTQVTWGTDQETRWECRLRTGANITNCIIWVGLKLTNTEVTITDDDQAFFRYEDDVNSGKWQAISSIGGADDAHDSGVAVAVDTEYRLTLAIQSDRTVLFYIDGSLVETSAPLTDAIDLIPYIGVAADGAAAGKSIHVRGQTIRRNYA
jgi:hypothetical protein